MSHPPEPSELIYSPGDSWAPILIAVGLALAVAGAFNGWLISAIGGLIVLAGIRVWWRRGEDEISRMRREQRTDTAVIPAEPAGKP